MGFLSSTQHPDRSRNPPTLPAQDIGHKEQEHEVTRSVIVYTMLQARPPPPPVYLAQNVTKHRDDFNF